MLLEELIGDITLESSRMEAKSRLNRKDPGSWLKTIAGLANAQGGDFYIGVEDRTNQLMGFERSEADEERNFLNNQINEHLMPRPQVNISFIRYTVKDKERFVIRAVVPESPVKPVILKYGGVPAIYMRRDGFTNGATYEEIIEMSVKSSGAQYDTLTSDVPYDPRKFATLREFYAAHNDRKQLSDKLLRSLGFFDENGLLANGAALFADDYEGSKTLVQCALFAGFNKGSDRITTINRFSGSLIAAIRFMTEFVVQRMNRTVRKLDSSRENIDAYPRRALFEGIVNAVAHRDYFLDGSQIQLDMFRDRLEITSPGSFFRGEKIAKTYDLSRIISKRRNELIAAVLVRCNVMEAAGTGFDKIVEDYRGVDAAHRPFIYSMSDHFTLVLPDLTYAEGISDIGELEFAPVPNGSGHDGKILSYCYKQAHKASDIATHLGIANSTWLRTKILANLVKENYLQKDKIGRAVYFKTNPDAVRER